MKNFSPTSFRITSKSMDMDLSLRLIYTCLIKSTIITNKQNGTAFSSQAGIKNVGVGFLLLIALLLSLTAYNILVNTNNSGRQSNGIYVAMMQYTNCRCH